MGRGEVEEGREEGGREDTLSFVTWKKTTHAAAVVFFGPEEGSYPADLGHAPCLQ